MTYRCDPQEWTIESDRDGFFLMNEFGEEAEYPSICYTSFAAAREALDKIIRADLDAYDGAPDGDAWSGGFAENH